MAQSRSTLALAVTTVLGLTTTTLMFALPGEAAPTPTTFSAETQGDVWRINHLDLDMSGDPQELKLDVARVQGLTGQAASPDRSRAQSHNLFATPTPSGQKVASSTASKNVEPTGAVTAAGQAGQLAGVLDYDASALTARGRWGGDQECLDPAAALTSSRSITQGSGTLPAAIPAGTPPLVPIPLPTSAPTEIPTDPPSGFPTGLPSDLPTLPVPTVTVPTITLPFGDGGGAQRAEGDVAMMEVGAASVEQQVLLEENPATAITTDRRVATKVIGKALTPGAPVAQFFGGEATLSMAGPATLTAYSDGGANGSQVTWAPPAMALTVDGEEYAVPTDGSALALPYSRNQDVVLSVAAGTLQSAESPQGTLAQASVSVLHVIIKHGDVVALDAELFPMTVKSVAPTGGVDCTSALPGPKPTRVDPRLKVTGKHTGAKDDRLSVKAIRAAAGAKFTVTRAVGKKQKVVARGTLGRKGARVVKVKDANAAKATKYTVNLGRTAKTTKDRARHRVR